jgi:uncharacterized protein YndB with AHSA1/START domain
MPQQSSENRLAPSTSHALDDGPVFESVTAVPDSGEQVHRIRARRYYLVSPDEVFAAWASRSAWESWMRLRARSRASLSPYPGGAFRLELAEGPTIHVITGEVLEARRPELLSMTWVHHGRSDRSSTVDLSIRARRGLTELVLVHSHIENRREASWLMRLWSAALLRLGPYLTDFEYAPGAMAHRGDPAAELSMAAKADVHPTRMPTTFARSA